MQSYSNQSEQSSFFSQNSSRIEKAAPVSISQSDRGLLISFLTIKDLRNLLFDPSVNLNTDFNDDLINQILIPDLNQIIVLLANYDGTDRTGIRDAQLLAEGALKELYSISATGVEKSAKTRDRFDALISCRGKLEDAYRHLEHLNSRLSELKNDEEQQNESHSQESLSEDVEHEQISFSIEDDVQSSHPVRRAESTFQFQSGQTRIEIHFGGEPATIVPWELDVDALVIPVGTLGSLSGKMATGFLDALGQQSQDFRTLLKEERSKRKPTQDQPELSRYIEPETPLLLATEGKFPNLKPRHIIAATAYRRRTSPANPQVQKKSPKIILKAADESQDTLEVPNAGDAAEAIIRLSAKNNLETIAMPLLGTGAAGLPSIDVAGEMLAAIRGTVANTSLRQVTLLTRDWGAYTYLVGLVQPKPQKSLNDLSEGVDQLRVKAEIDALADTLLLAETETPLAVGILGGWGSGKSFAMHMLRERMAEIRAMAASDEYVGHLYLIDFDAWTYTKSNLWSSLMQTIFLELNRQLERERKLAPGREATDLEKVRAIYPGTRTQTGKVKVSNEALWDQLRDYRSQEREELEKQEKLLDEKRIELAKKHQETAEEVDKAIQKEIDEAIWQPLIDALAKPFGKSWQYQFGIIFGKAVPPEAREPQAFRTWLEFSAFSLFALVAFLVPALFEQFREFQYPGILLAIGTSVTGLLRTFDRWKTEVDEARAKIRNSREARLKEKLDEKKKELNSIEQDIKTLEIKVSDARRLAGVTATFDSLLELCQARLRQADYENELGLMHRVKLDLDEMDWALKKAQKSLDAQHPAFLSRGKPRIVLFIDDLDRCPPQRVVEVLEATQLLLKTDLFVVIMAMDVRYVTRALEKVYEGILSRQGDPSGLDYIEKIIQIPYQVRPVDPKVVDQYIDSMMTVAREIVTSGNSTKTAQQKLEEHPLNTSEKIADEGNTENIKENPRQPRKPRTLSAISQVVTFSKDEYDFLVLCCQKINLTPRAIKRLVNVYKLLKILWSREPQWPQPQKTVEQAIILLLALSCAYPDSMRETFICITKEIRENELGKKTPQSISAFFADNSTETWNSLSKLEWQKLQSDLQNLWGDVKNAQQVNVLHDLQLPTLKDALPLVCSFSFVGDLGYEEE